MAKTAKTYEPMEQTIGQDAPRKLKSTGRSKEALESALIQTVDRPVDQEKLAMLAFNEDMVTVHIHPTTNREDEQIFELFNAGQREIFRRGETKEVKRKFVEILARAKTTSFSNQEKFQDGVKDYVYQPHTGLRYPFSVRHDPHSRGGEWLTAILSEA